MSNFSRRGLRITAAAAGAGAIAAAAWATTHAGPADAATSPGNGGAVTSTRVHLSPMPQGTVTFGRDRKGNVDVTVNAVGLTPGSRHKVELMNGRGAVAVFLGRFTALLRALMPALAGSAKMPYGRCLAFNALGGIAWGVG